MQTKPHMSTAHEYLHLRQQEINYIIAYLDISTPCHEASQKPRLQLLRIQDKSKSTNVQNGFMI